MGKIKKLYTYGEVRTILKITEKELLLAIKELFPDFNKRTGYRFTENEFSQIKATIENHKS
jgi:hypothetical protein